MFKWTNTNELIFYENWNEDENETEKSQFKLFHLLRMKKNAWQILCSLNREQSIKSMSRIGK